MVNSYKEVYFCEFCHLCQYENLPEDVDPCYDCLSEPINLNSHKPIAFKEKESAHENA